MQRTTGPSSIRDEKSARKDGTTSPQLWLKKIRAQKSDPLFDDWHKDAKMAVAAYENGELEGVKISGANLFHANVETVTPAIYNSSPVPDIRVRFEDNDKAKKMACDMMERTAIQDMDQCRFDDIMLDLVRKAGVVGEGVVRVRYEPKIKTTPKIDPVTMQPVLDETGEPEFEDSVESDKVFPEVVPWDRIIFGPARTFERTPWVAFEHDMMYEEVVDLNPTPIDRDGNVMADRLTFGGGSVYAQNRGNDNSDNKPEDENTGIFQTIKIFEVWDKRTKQVLWIADNDAADIVARMDDPLRLEGFFPFGMPLRPINKTDRQLPLVHYAQHKALFDEFERVSTRINALAAELRVRGLYDAKQAPDFASLKDAKDGEYFPASAAEAFVEGGQKRDLTGAVLHWPIEIIIQVIKELNAHREIIKGLIWEATGVADIMRGQSNASETLGAQELKTEWGSMRVRKFQSETARVARDLIRLMIEVRANLTPWEYLKQLSAMKFEPTQEDIAAAMQELQQQAQQSAMQTGIPPNPAMIQMQAQQMAQDKAQEFERQVEAIIRTPTRSISIDIETDSTIRGDVSRDMEQFNQLITATGTFAQAITGLAPILPQTIPAMFKVYASQVTKFRLGKMGEDALDELQEAAKAPPQNPDAQQGMSEQEMQAQQAQQQHEKDMAAQDQQAKAADNQTKLQLGQQKADLEQVKAQTHAQTAQVDMQVNQQQNEHEALMAQLQATLGTTGNKPGMAGTPNGAMQ